MLDYMSAPQLEESEHYLQWLELRMLQDNFEEITLEEINSMLDDAALHHQEG